MTLGWLECPAIKHIEWSLRDLSELYVLFVRNMRPSKVKHPPCCSHPAELVLEQLSGWDLPANSLLPHSTSQGHRHSSCLYTSFIHSQTRRPQMLVCRIPTCSASWTFCSGASAEVVPEKVIRSHTLRINSQDSRTVSYSLANFHLVPAIVQVLSKLLVNKTEILLCQTVIGALGNKKEPLNMPCDV